MELKVNPFCRAKHPTCSSTFILCILSICVYICLYVCTYGYMLACMHACMYVHMEVCKDVCMCNCVCIFGINLRELNACTLLWNHLVAQICTQIHLVPLLLLLTFLSPFFFPVA